MPPRHKVFAGLSRCLATAYRESALAINTHTHTIDTVGLQYITVIQRKFQWIGSPLRETAMSVPYTMPAAAAAECAQWSGLMALTNGGPSKKFYKHAYYPPADQRRFLAIHDEIGERKLIVSAYLLCGPTAGKSDAYSPCEEDWDSESEFTNSKNFFVECSLVFSPPSNGYGALSQTFLWTHCRFYSLFA